MITSIAQLSELDEDFELISTAVHEAGHALWAVRHGIVVREASIEPSGHSAGRVRHEPAEVLRAEDCTVTSSWWRAWVMFSLSGDRAARLLDPLQDTSAGAPSSDYAKAVRILHAVLGRTGLVDQELDQLSRRVDAWFEQPHVERDLLLLASLLLKRRTLSGREIYATLSGGLCGAVHPDGYLTCQNPKRHPTGPHYATFAPEPWLPNSQPPFLWDGWPMRGPAAQREKPTAHMRKVQRALDGETAPPRKVGLTEDEFNAIRLRMRNNEPVTDAERTRVAQFMAARSGTKRSTPLPRPGQAATDVGAHDCLVEGVVEVATLDQDATFCPNCGHSTAPVKKGYAYQVVELVRVKRGDADQFQRIDVAVDDLLYASADSAAAYLRLVRAHGRAPILQIRERRLG